MDDSDAGADIPRTPENTAAFAVALSIVMGYDTDTSKLGYWFIVQRASDAAINGGPPTVGMSYLWQGLMVYAIEGVITISKERRGKRRKEDEALFNITERLRLFNSIRAAVAIMVDPVRHHALTAEVRRLDLLAPRYYVFGRDDGAATIDWPPHSTDHHNRD